jgi:hypothetical protein
MDQIITEITCQFESQRLTIDKGVAIEPYWSNIKSALFAENQPGTPSATIE